MDEIQQLILMTENQLLNISKTLIKGRCIRLHAD